MLSYKNVAFDSLPSGSPIIRSFERIKTRDFASFVKDDSGATAIEYGLIAALIGIGIIAVMKNVRTGLQSTFNKVNSELGAGSAQ